MHQARNASADHRQGRGAARQFSLGGSVTQQPGLAAMPLPSAVRAQVQELLATRRKFFTLPQAFYTDPEIFTLDLEAVFYRRWIFAGPECEIPNPGDYFTLSI